MSLFLYSALIKYFIAKKCKLSSDNARLPPTFDLFLFCFVFFKKPCNICKAQ